MHRALPPLLCTPSRRDFTCISHIWPGRDMRNSHYDLRKVVSDTMLYCTRQIPNSISASQVANPDETRFDFVQLLDGSLRRTTISPSAKWSVVVHHVKRFYRKQHKSYFLRSVVKTRQGVHNRGWGGGGAVRAVSILTLLSYKICILTAQYFHPPDGSATSRLTPARTYRIAPSARSHTQNNPKCKSPLKPLC
jgi:hypothetical protein